jgi:hypothetical protein
MLAAGSSTIHIPCAESADSISSLSHRGLILWIFVVE